VSKIKTPPASAAWSLNFNLPPADLVVFTVSIASARKFNLSKKIQIKFRALAIETVENIRRSNLSRLKLNLHEAKAGVSNPAVPMQLERG